MTNKSTTNLRDVGIIATIVLVSVILLKLSSKDDSIKIAPAGASAAVAAANQSVVNPSSQIAGDFKEESANLTDTFQALPESSSESIANVLEPFWTVSRAIDDTVVMDVPPEIEATSGTLNSGTSGVSDPIDYGGGSGGTGGSSSGDSSDAGATGERLTGGAGTSGDSTSSGSGSTDAVSSGQDSTSATTTTGGGGSAYDSNTSSVPDAVKIPGWISTDKIRAGYFGASEDTSHASLMSQIGLNTMIVKWSEFAPGNSWNDAMVKYANWAKAGKNNNLHVFLAFNWLPMCSDFVYPNAVFADGTVSVAVCPLNKDFWANYMNHIGRGIATLSLDPDVTIDGIFLDNELYGTEQKRNYERDYGLHACFCDSCFSKFLISRGYSSDQFPIAAASERQSWLRNHDLLEAYYDYLKDQISSLAATFESEVRKINPKLILGMYPTLTCIPYKLGENWVRESIARAWGTVDFPMVLFATDTYYTGGYSRIPNEPIDLYRQSGIHIVYCAGYMLSGKYTSNDIETNLYESARRADGYWLYRMTQLWNASEESELFSGSQTKYLNSISKANETIKNLP